MSRIKRGGFVFMTWKNDHAPRHVHIYLDARLHVKWDLEKCQEITGQAGARLKRLIRELVREGRL